MYTVEKYSIRMIFDVSQYYVHEGSTINIIDPAMEGDLNVFINVVREKKTLELKVKGTYTVNQVKDLIEFSQDSAGSLFPT